MIVMSSSIFANQVCKRITVGVKDPAGDSFPSPTERSKLVKFLRLPVRPETACGQGYCQLKTLSLLAPFRNASPEGAANGMEQPSGNAVFCSIRITEDVRKYAAAQGIAEEEASSAARKKSRRSLRRRVRRFTRRRA
jgi:hypothetical protein